PLPASAGVAVGGDWMAPASSSQAEYCYRGHDMSAADATPVRHDVPFLDVVAPEFDFNSPEVAEAQARSWYAETPGRPARSAVCRGAGAAARPAAEPQRQGLYGDERYLRGADLRLVRPDDRQPRRRGPPSLARLGQQGLHPTYDKWPAPVYPGG